MLGVSISTTHALAASEANSREFNKDILGAVSELYGISESQAVNRLAQETEAAITFQKIRQLSIDSYAGSWFDASRGKLNVAIADVKDHELLMKFSFLFRSSL